MKTTVMKSIFLSAFCFLLSALSAVTQSKTPVMAETNGLILAPHHLAVTNWDGGDPWLWTFYGTSPNTVARLGDVVRKFNGPSDGQIATNFTGVGTFDWGGAAFGPLVENVVGNSFQFDINGITVISDDGAGGVAALFLNGNALTSDTNTQTLLIGNGGDFKRLYFGSTTPWYWEDGVGGYPETITMEWGEPDHNWSNTYTRNLYATNIYPQAATANRLAAIGANTNIISSVYSDADIAALQSSSNTFNPNQFAKSGNMVSLTNAPLITNTWLIGGTIATNQNSATDPLRVQNTNTTQPAFLVRSNGNVGIVTNAPQQALHVYGNGIFEGPSGNITNAGAASIAAGTFIINTSGNVSKFGGQAGTGIQKNAIDMNNGSGGICTLTANDGGGGPLSLRAGTGGNVIIAEAGGTLEYARFRSTGVGFGTTNPLGSLHITNTTAKFGLLVQTIATNSLAQFQTGNTLKFAVETNGPASYSNMATNAIAASGYTNLTGANQTALVTATAVSFTVVDRAAATIYTSPTLTTTLSIPLQPGWGITSANGLSGTVIPGQ